MLPNFKGNKSWVASDEMEKINKERTVVVQKSIARACVFSRETLEIYRGLKLTEDL